MTESRRQDPVNIVNAHYAFLIETLLTLIGQTCEPTSVVLPFIPCTDATSLVSGAKLKTCSIIRSVIHRYAVI